MSPTVALAVSGHGFGHSVRCAEVARALVARGARIKLRTEAPLWLFPGEVEALPSPGWPIDIGVAQHDGLELDLNETRARWRAFAAEFEKRAENEAQLLREHQVDVVLGDIPPVAFAAASRAGIPSVALANFTWDWIYAAWPDFEDIVACVRQGYARADGLLRLPLHAETHEAFCAFKRIDDVPLIARKARRGRNEVRDELAIPAECKTVLVSFGGFTAHGLDLEALGQWGEYLFVLTPPIVDGGGSLPGNVLALNETPADYVSLVAACDVVVTKPGYGIVADCLANRVAVLFTDRGPFREYDVLAAALPELGQARYIPRDEVLAGNLGPYLDELLVTSARWTTEPMNGADVVAEHLLSFLTVKQQFG